MAYTSYEFVGDGAGKPPIFIMHGLLGSKSNWHGLSKAIHKTTHRKVRTKKYNKWTVACIFV